jgi:membrane associated rhomboid family serine protease
VPPSDVRELPDDVRFGWGRDTRWLVAAFAVAAVGYGVLSVVGARPDGALHAVAWAILLLVVEWDRRTALMCPVRAAMRTQFAFDLAADPRSRTITFLAIGFVIAIGVGQLLLEYALGGMRPLWDRIGILYDELDRGAYWRLLPGAYLHYTFLHFAMNAVSLVLLAPLAFRLLGVRSLFVFVLGASLSLGLQWALGSREFDNAGGMSGGCFALLGAIAGVGFRRREALPPGLTVLLSGATVAVLLLAEARNPASATVAHGSGLFLGLTMGACTGVLPASAPRRSRTHAAPD